MGFYLYMGIVFSVAFVAFSSASAVLIYKDVVREKKSDKNGKGLL